MESVTYFAVPNIPLIHAGDDLARIVFERTREAALTLSDGDVLVFAQKVVSKCNS